VLSPRRLDLRWLGRYFGKPFAPFAASLAVVGLFLLLSKNPSAVLLPDGIPALLRSATAALTSPEQAAALAAKRTYLASILVTDVMMLGLAGVSIVTFCRWGKRSALFLASSIVVAFAALAFDLHNYWFNQDDRWVGALTSIALNVAEELRHGVGVRLIVFRTVCLLWLAGLSLVLAVGAATLGTEETDLDQRKKDLASRVARVQFLASLSAAPLVTGIVGASLLQRWFQALAPSLNDALQPLGRVEVLETGVLYTTALMAVFGTAELALRAEVPTLADHPKAKRLSRSKWMAELGFAESQVKRLVNVVTLLAPLLAAVTQNVISLK
jgi:hypothetical protein